MLEKSEQWNRIRQSTIAKDEFGIQISIRLKNWRIVIGNLILKFKIKIKNNAHYVIKSYQNLI